MAVRTIRNDPSFHRKLNESLFCAEIAGVDHEHHLIDAGLLQTFDRAKHESQKNRNREPLESSCQWLFNHPIYTDWRRDESSRIIEISGAPGSGKSVLARKILDDDFEGVECVKTYFFFRKGGDEGQDSASTALRTILHQLLSARPHIVETIPSSIYEDQELKHPRMDGLVNLLLRVINGWNSGLLLCVLDGLDECEEHGKDEILDILRTVCDHARSLPRSPSAMLKFLFTSRSHILMEHRLKRAIPTIKLSGQDEAAAINREIDHIVRSRLDDISLEFALDETIKTILLERLLRVPQQTYLWVTLVFEEIRLALQKSRESLAAFVDSLPQTLSDPYELLLQEALDKKEARRLLQTILVAQRPLSVTEIDVVLALESSSTSYGTLSRKGEQYIRSLCGLFITVSEGKLYFIQDTAREFLIKMSGSKDPAEKTFAYRLELQNAHRMLAKMCITHLLFDDFTKDPLNIIWRGDLSEPRKPAYLPWVQKNYILGRMGDLFKHHSQLGDPPLDKKGKRPEQLTSFGNDDGQCSTARLASDYCTNNPLLEYSAVYWHIHVKESNFPSDDETWRDVMQLYTGPTFTTWFSIYWATKPLTELPHFTALTVAMALDQESIAPLLIANGAEIDEEDPFKQRALHWAACNGSYEMVDLLLRHDAYVDPRDSVLRTPLHLAVLKGRDGPRKASLLIRMGAEIDAADVSGLTPLHLVGNDATLARLLIEHHADLEREDVAGRTPLIMAAANNAADVARVLLASGAKLTDAAIYRAGFTGNAQVITLFEEWRDARESQILAERAAVAARAASLLNAAETGDLNELLQSVQNGISLDSCDLNGDSALHLAVRENHIHAIKYLLDAGIHPNLRNLSSLTPLHIAAECGHSEAIRCLLKLDGSKSKTSKPIPDSDPRGSSDLGSQHEPTPPADPYEAADIEARTSTGRTPLFVAAHNGHINAVQVLLDADADINCEEYEGANVLFLPVFEARTEMVKLLLERGANVNGQEREYGFTPLFGAVMRNDLEMARLLLDNGADLHMRSTSKMTQTARAMSDGNEGMVDLLFEYGADITAIDANSRSLLHWAVISDVSEEMISFLLENGIDPHLMDADEKTAADHARQKGSRAIADLIDRASPQVPKDPMQTLVESILKSIDAIQNWMLQQPSPVALKLTSAHPSRVSPTPEDVPEAISILRDTAMTLQGLRLVSTENSQSSGSSEALFDQGRVWPCLLQLLRVLPPKGHQVEPQATDTNKIDTLTMKIIFLLLKADDQLSVSEEGVEEEEEEDEKGRADSFMRNATRSAVERINEQNRARRAQGTEWIPSASTPKSDNTDRSFLPVEPSVVEDIPISSGPGDLYQFKRSVAESREAEKIRSRGNDAYFTRHGYPISVMMNPHDSERTKTEENRIQTTVASQTSVTESRSINELIYEQLPDRTIRVMDLLPGSAADPICVNLRPVSIDNPGTYEALSYTWGGRANLRGISVNGHAFEATENLFAALTRLRNEANMRTLWVDAIAINQSSVDERTQQVRLMTDIYGKADQVLVWLGESKNDTALETLFKVAHERNDYATAKLWLELPEGETPLLLFSDNSHCMQIVTAVLEQFNRRRGVTGPSRALPPTWFKAGADPRFIFLGYKTLPDPCQPSDCLFILPDFDINQVQRSALQSYPTPEEFLIDAAKPALLEISDQKMLEVFDGLTDLLDRPYWQRAWIVQEVIASQKCTLYFSKQDQSIDIDTLGSVYASHQQIGVGVKNFMLEDFSLFDAAKNQEVLNRLCALRSQKFFSNMSNLSTFSRLTSHRKHRGSQTWTFDRLLLSYAGQKATDARDKVFSLIGLLQLFSTNPEEHGWCQRTIDYTLDTRSVYLNAARHLVESHQQRGRDDPKMLSAHVLDDFYKTRDEKSNVARLPTWVPNWESETDQWVVFNTAGVHEIDTLIPYDAHVSGDALLLSGHSVDEVYWVSDEISGADKSMYAEVDIWLKVLENNWGAVYGSDAARFDAFWRTVIVDNAGGTKASDHLTDHFHGQAQVTGWLQHCRDNLSQLRQIWGDKLQDRSRLGPIVHGPDGGGGSRATQTIGSSSRSLRLRQPNHASVTVAEGYRGTPETVAEALLMRMEAVEPPWQYQGARAELSPRHFVISKKGYFGRGSPGVRVGDSITLLAGSAYPWCLRRGEGNQSVIAARAWIHGLMYRHDAYYTDWETKEIAQMALE
ncbi:hypothetical protein PV04_03747 [Phialophora macrospora]|uniref:Uncharacterized protein n=1 Tax=Phialophora macrospora TaxID=1851006 RepID=A0A0D2GH76_9EURO|nr:hypothetical protein PV04_03747 [Phialophora macrospora]